jgi:hypothetical protein
MRLAQIELALVLSILDDLAFLGLIERGLLSTAAIVAWVLSLCCEMWIQERFVRLAASVGPSWEIQPERNSITA